ncbi:glycosyltransferase [Clostridium sp. YIM B02555]|uniref:glycosyltransferase n=1 Tax=Clostridium sp. YIM B02555 TaxID=2911968 RepID=UPI001EEED491|nr:glycosyltransferase [Clostridium sp. YIM B02555]
MKIWYLTSEFPPDFGGGITMYIENAANMFSEAGHEVTVLVRDSNGSSIKQTKDNLRVVRFLHMEGEYYSYLGYWAALSYQYAEEVLKLIDKDGSSPDIIEVQDYNALGYYLMQKKYEKDERLKNVKIVVHLHTPTFELSRINQLARYKFPIYWLGQMEKFCIKAADAIVTQSEFLKSHIQPFAVEQDIKVIPLPYKFNNIYAKPKAIENEDNNLLYMGRLEYRKGILQLLKAADNLWNEGLDFKLTLLGGDTFFSPKQKMMGDIIREKYKKRIEENKIIFKEPVPPAQLNAEISKFKSVIIPSLYENYPYNCLISMSQAKPVIVSKSGGQSEMVGESDKNGFIFDWDIEGSCEDTIRKVLKMENEELQQIGLNGYDRIKKLCDISENIKIRTEFFDNILNSKKENERMYPVSDSIPPRVDEKINESGQKGLLSIIIPYYNLGEYLPETLENALSIDYDNYEIIIVNDGTNDENSIKVLDEIRVRSNPKIRIVDIQNGGLANARNVGAKEAKGEFIAFLDADDLISSDFYGKAIKMLNSYDNISFVYSWVRYFGGTRGVWPTFNTEFPYFLGMNMLTAFVVVRKVDFIKYGSNRKEMEYGMEDYEGWVSMCENGCSGVSIPETLVQYRVRAESMSRQFNRDMVIYLLDKLSSSHPKLFEKHGLEIYNLIIANGPGYLWNNPTFEYPIVGHLVSENVSEDNVENNKQKYELLRIVESKMGSKLIKMMFKLKLNRLIK